MYLTYLPWQIKKYDWSRQVMWAGDKSSCLPPDVMSHGTCCALVIMDVTSKYWFAASRLAHLKWEAKA